MEVCKTGEEFVHEAQQLTAVVVGVLGLDAVDVVRQRPCNRRSNKAGQGKRQGRGGRGVVTQKAR